MNHVICSSNKNDNHSTWREFTKTTFLFCAAMIGLGTCLPNSSVADDWPTYMHDNARAGHTTESIKVPLQLRWTISADTAPQMAWAGPNERTFEGKILRGRITFDDAFHVAVAGDRLYYGSSVDDQLHCVDINNGKELWSFYSGGPIRLAPTVVEGRVFFGSDDGNAYCLNSEDGGLIWKHRAGPDDDWLIARQEMISRWPIRTGILVDDGIAYFGAGIFPHENIYLYAVNANDGSLIWKRDTISEEDAGRNDLSPQGYLLANDELLFVPSGRSLPAAVDRKTGKVVHKRVHGWRGDAGGVVGGSKALLASGQIFCWGDHHILPMEQKTGDVGYGWFTGYQLAMADEFAFTLSGQSLIKVDRDAYAAGSRKRHKMEQGRRPIMRKIYTKEGEELEKAKTELKELEAKIKKAEDVGVNWKTPFDGESSLLVAGDLVFAGKDGEVAAFSAETGKSVWSAPVDGEARGLAVAGGNLFVSTSTGKIYAFASADTPAAPSAVAKKNIGADPYPQDELTKFYQDAAADILKTTGVNRGFALVLGNEQGRLAYELARQSELTLYCLEPDADKVAAARKALNAAGLYGSRVTVHQADFAPVPYSSYFANLIVSDTQLLGGTVPGNPAEIARHLKPLGGVVYLGGKTDDPSQAVQSRQDWLEGMKLADQSHTSTEGAAIILTRDKLPGAANWSHQYGDPGNTASSTDRRLKGGLGVLWYGDPGPGKMVNRHDGAVGPLSIDGRLIVQGENSVMAYDAYNGMFLWERAEPNAVRTGVFQNQNPGNLVAGGDDLFVMVRGECHNLDLATGEIKATYTVPPEAGGEDHEWGYLAYQDGLLIGTATIRQEVERRKQRRGKVTDDSTTGLFAIDTKTGKTAWSYQGKHIAHHTIALGPERVFFIDSTITSDQRDELLREDKTELKKLTGDEAKEAEERMKRIDARLAVALDARTGEKLWETPVDVTDCSEIGTGGGKLTLMVQNNVLVLCGANANGHYWKQFLEGEFKSRRLVALSGEDGHKLWAKDANYRHRPIIIEDQIVAEPWGFDLYTGAQRMRKHPITGEEVPWSMVRTGHHCGMMTATPDMMFFRSGFTGFYDLNADNGTRHFAGHRTGCWINMIPANGLLMVPEASAGCVCLFSIASTIVMEPREPRRDWTIYSSVGKSTPVKHLALNFGAPGDRRDAGGTVWLAYPRPKAYKETGLVLPLELQTGFADGGKYSGINSQAEAFTDVESPWIYSYWAEGLKQLTIPLQEQGAAPASYRVKFYFTGRHGGDPSAAAKFDVKIQGETLLENVGLGESDHGNGRSAVHEVAGISVTDNLVVEFVPRDGSDAPILSGIKIERE